MKIALCLSGELRTFKHCYKTVSTAFPTADVDIFITTWNREDTSFAKSLDRVKSVVPVDDNSSIFDRFKVLERKWIISGLDQIAFTDFMKPLPIFLLGRIEYLAKMSFERAGPEYDYYIRSRPDTKYLTDIERHLVQDKVLVSEDIGGSAPHDTWAGTRMIYDGFAAGSYDLMKRYYSFTDWLPDYLSHHNEPIKAERTLGYFLQKVVQLPLKYKRDILGLQLNENDWYNRSTPNTNGSLLAKRKFTFEYYKKNLEKYHKDLYEKYRNKLA